MKEKQYKYKTKVEKGIEEILKAYHDLVVDSENPSFDDLVDDLAHYVAIQCEEVKEETVDMLTNNSA